MQLLMTMESLVLGVHVHITPVSALLALAVVAEMK